MHGGNRKQTDGKTKGELTKLTFARLRYRTFRLLPRPRDIRIDRAAVPHHRPVARYQVCAMALCHRPYPGAGAGGYWRIYWRRLGSLLDPYACPQCIELRSLCLD